ncbi:MAG: class I SAM-dependent methyltransferase [Chloroflexi bacterium]|nr:class I SAM-dependent methyltransferase [Chloroflexota bacterium]
MQKRFTDQNYLTKDQYKDSSNLDARIVIHQKFSTNPQGWFNWIFDELVKLPAKAKILELGCGTGEMWKQCVDRIPADWNITLSDLSDGMLDSAWRNLVVTGRGFKFEKMDAQSIPYADGTFDAVIANHMLYHVPDRKLALTEIRRVLKTDGVLFASTVGENHMKEMYGWLKRINTNPGGGMFTNPFTMESGADQLRGLFSNVTQARYEDNLRVTEVERLIAYIRSSIGAVDISEDELGKLQGEFTATLSTTGEIFISKDSGLFIARN